MLKTTCPLDCYDSCSVVYEGGKLRGDKDHPFTNGFLCPNLNSFLKVNRIESARFGDKNISIDQALTILSDKLRKSKNSIYFKGSGNFGIMQDIPSVFFHQYGSDFTKGSLCDGAGEAGIVEGRGESLHLPPSQIAKSDVVVIWGRNISVTNSHMMPILKDKTVIVIDPRKTEIAKKADIHIQIKPRTDLYLAILLARFVHMQQLENMEFIKNRTENFDDFIDFIHSLRINFLMNESEISIDDLNKTVDLISTKRVSFLVGLGVQKYSHGATVLRAIDSLGAMLGLFGKEGCGVSYLGNSSYGFTKLFKQGMKQIPKPTVNFGNYDLSFIQGSNPANQMPCTQKVIDGLRKSNFVVYFGLYKNETSALADLVIPAKNFLEKDDFRFSYGHEYIGRIPKLIDSEIGISEYELTQYLCHEFGFESSDKEKKIIKEVIDSNSLEKDGFLISKSYENIPYRDKFFTDSGKFIFFDELEDYYEEEKDGYFLLTAKSKYSLNSQFKRREYLYVPSSSGLKDDDIVEVNSKYGKYKFIVKIDDNLRDDSVFIESGVSGVNFLTPNLYSDEGYNAIYQELKVTIRVK